jgi:hypothetical protein
MNIQIVLCLCFLWWGWFCHHLPVAVRPVFSNWNLTFLAPVRKMKHSNSKLVVSTSDGKVHVWIALPAPVQLWGEQWRCSMGAGLPCVPLPQPSPADLLPDDSRSLGSPVCFPVSSCMSFFTMFFEVMNSGSLIILNMLILIKYHHYSGHEEITILMEECTTIIIWCSIAFTIMRIIVGLIPACDFSSLYFE